MPKLWQFSIPKLDSKIADDIEKREEPLSKLEPFTQQKVEAMKQYGHTLFWDPMKVLKEHVLRNYKWEEAIKLSDMIDKHFVVHHIPVLITDQQNIFQLFDQNRLIKTAWIRNLAGSKKENGMYPRIWMIDKDLNIIDGQHDSTSSSVLQQETSESYPTVCVIVDRDSVYIDQMMTILNSDGSNWWGWDHLRKNASSMDQWIKEKYERLVSICDKFNVKEAWLKELIRSWDKKAWEKAYKKWVISFTKQKEEQVWEFLVKIKKIHGYITWYEQDQKSSDWRRSRKAQKPITRAMVTWIKSFITQTNESYKNILVKLEGVQDIKKDWLENRAIWTANQVRDLLFELCD